MIKIYTKTGDKGQTSLYGGKRVSKADLRVHTYGEIDELSSLIGVVTVQNQRSKIKDQKYGLKIKNVLIEIQNDLFTIGSSLAGAENLSDLKIRIKEFEETIDELSRELPDLKNFVLPGGGETGSFLHLARAVCRRAERSIVQLSKKERVESSILIYFNRLSDLLFVMARFVNFKEKRKEVVWPSFAKASEGKTKK